VKFQQKLVLYAQNAAKKHHIKYDIRIIICLVLLVNMRDNIIFALHECGILYTHTFDVSVKIAK